jgi:hypothetical protein
VVNHTALLATGVKKGWSRENFTGILSLSGRSVVTALTYLRVYLSRVMCHCFTSIEELSEAERAEVLEEHTESELRAEYSSEELAALGVEA